MKLLRFFSIPLNPKGPIRRLLEGPGKTTYSMIELGTGKLFKKLIDENRHEKLIDHQSLGEAARLAVPTPEPYLPMLYAIALKEDDETIANLNDKPLAGSLTMTSLLIEK